MFSKTSAVLSLTAVMTAAGIGYSTSTFADDNSQHERAAIESASITMADAIQLAETETGGRAVEAEVEDENDTDFFYEIEVVNPDGSTQEVLIDMASAEILEIRNDDWD